MSNRSSIVLVEDDENDALLMSRACKLAGLAPPISVLPDGEAAICYLKGEYPYSDRQQHPLPHLLILDLKMPKVSGFDVLSWVRSHPELRRMVVIILTSSREPRDVERAYDLRVNSYLVKPTGFHDLVALVRMLNEYWLGVNQAPDPVSSMRDSSLARWTV